MDFKDHVKSSVDIVRVVGDYVRLKKSGSERWVGLCPFHSEKTPSFSVQSRLQIYKCFGCGKSGDVFNFVMEHQGLSFYEALTMLAEQNGIPVPQRREGPQADAETKRREALHAMHDIAQRHFAQQLNSPAGREALAYLGPASSTAKTSSVSGWATRRPAIACLPFFAGRAFRMSTWPNPAWLTVRPRGGTSTIFSATG
ncbi:MAG: CHC2 zinc finger domain-containing protein [Bryobacterales bacterium]